MQQGELSLEPEPAGKGADKGELMGALDLLNRRYGRGTVLVWVFRTNVTAGFGIVTEDFGPS